MATVMTTLDELVNAYLQDSEYHQHREEISLKRRAGVGYYKQVLLKFITGSSGLNELNNDLKRLHQETYWGGHSTGFLMELNKLVKNHISTNPDFEANFRYILKDLTAQNIGPKIEDCYNLFAAEWTRLKA